MVARKMRAGFSLVELLIVVAVVGTLVAMLLPAVQKARSLAQRIECSNNLKQQGVALHTYHQQFGVFPPGRVDPNDDALMLPNGKNLTGFTLLLPFLEEDALYQQYDLTKMSTDGSSAANLDVVGTKMKIYTCPSAPEPTIDNFESADPLDAPFECKNAREGSYLFCYYATFWDMVGTSGPRGAFGNQITGYKHPASARHKDIKDGLSTTIAIGETRRDHARVGIYYDFGFRIQVPHWGSGHALAVAGGMVCAEYTLGYPMFLMPINQKAGKNLEAQFWGGPTNPYDPEYHKLLWGGYGSSHSGRGANFLFCDGAVNFLHDNISFPVYKAMGTINSGDAVPSIN